MSGLQLPQASNSNSFLLQQPSISASQPAIHPSTSLSNSNNPLGLLPSPSAPASSQFSLSSKPIKKIPSAHEGLAVNGTGSTTGVEKRKRRKRTTGNQKLTNAKVGYLKKKGFFGTWKEHYFSVEAGSLMEFKDNKSKKAEKAYRLKEYTVQPAENLTGVPLSLSLMNSSDNKTIFLSANTPQEFREWMRALKSQCRLSNFEQTLENTLNAINDAAVLTDDAGTILSINGPATELYGWTKEELVGQDVKIIMTKDYADKHDEYMHRYRQTNEKRLIGKPRILPSIRKDGSVFFAEFSLGELTDGNQVRFLGTVRVHDFNRSNSSSSVSPYGPSSRTSSSEYFGQEALAAKAAVGLGGGTIEGLVSPRGSRGSGVITPRRNTTELELERQINTVTDNVRLIVSEELGKSAKQVQKYRARSKKLKKKNTKLQSEIVTLISDLRLNHRADQVSSMAFYSSLSDSEASNEQDMVVYLKNVITNEINACCSPGTLFRDDCHNTKKISSFFLYEGAGYVIITLEKALTELLAVTSEGDNLYELNDPSASEQELRAREKRILDGVYQLLAEIKNSTKDCPPSFGLLFKHLKLEVSKKFLPTSLDPYSIMSSFFFLRLLIPAIVQPQRYNLLNDVTISPGSRRGLMLISKILINMANGIVFNEEKMKVFNEAIAKNVPTLHSIFDEVMLMAEKHRGSITERGADSGESTGDDLSVDDVDSISQKD